MIHTTRMTTDRTEVETHAGEPLTPHIPEEGIPDIIIDAVTAAARTEAAITVKAAVTTAGTTAAAAAVTDRTHTA